jgi:four helix bundle protein
VRSADSIGANVAEAVGHWHVGDLRRLLLVARGSLYEAEHRMLPAEARAFLEEGSVDRLAQVARALNGLITKKPPS